MPSPMAWTIGRGAHTLLAFVLCTCNFIVNFARTWVDKRSSTKLHMDELQMGGLYLTHLFAKIMHGKLKWILPMCMNSFHWSHLDVSVKNWLHFHCLLITINMIYLMDEWVTLKIATWRVDGECRAQFRRIISYPFIEDDYLPIEGRIMQGVPWASPQLHLQAPQARRGIMTYIMRAKFNFAEDLDLSLSHGNQDLESRTTLIERSWNDTGRTMSITCEELQRQGTHIHGLEHL